MKLNLFYTLILANILFGNYAFSKSPVEGGDTVDSKSPLLESVIKLKNKNQQSSCSASFIASNWLITAAHCVVSDKGEQQLDPTFMNAEVDQILIHPKYQDFINKNIKDNLVTSNIHSQDVERNDLALIKLKNGSKKNVSLPVINKDTEFLKRGELTFIGSGATTTFYDRIVGKWIPVKQPEAGTFCSGSNVWGSSIKELSEIASALNKADILPSFSNLFQDIISESAGKEPIFSSSNIGKKATALPGDSGGPVIEKDQNGNPVLTAIVTMGHHETSNYKITIKEPSGVSTISISPKDESLFKTYDQSSLEIPEVVKELEKRGLVIGKGHQMRIKSGVSIERSFDRMSTTWAADLSDPENQSFLKAALGK